MIKIELATQNELDRVKEIAEACAKNMIENNIFQWNDKYPSREISVSYTHLTLPTTPYV